MIYDENYDSALRGEESGGDSSAAQETAGDLIVADTVEQSETDAKSDLNSADENCGGNLSIEPTAADDSEYFTEGTPSFSVRGEIYRAENGENDENGEDGGVINNTVKEYFSAPTEKIKKVADVFGEPEEKIWDEYKSFKAKKLFKRLDYFITDLPFSSEEFDGMCQVADMYSMFGVTVLPTAVPRAKSLLNGKAAVRAVISYPYGEDVFKVKLKAVKEAVKRGADGVAVVLSAGAVIGGDFKTITKEIKSYLKAAKKRRLTVAIDAAKLTPLQTENCCAAIKAAGGVHSAAVFSSEAGGALRLDAVKDVAKSLDNSLTVEVMGEVDTLDGAIGYFKNGANKLISEKSEQIAEDVKNKIKTA